MYGLPSDFDPSVFVSCRLIEICFTENTVYFGFDPGVSVTVEAAFVTQRPGKTARACSVPVHSSDAMAFIGARVSSASAGADGALRVGFEGGGAVVFLDDSQQYESYRIVVRGREIVV